MNAIATRKRNTNRNGGSFDAHTVQAVWEKAQPINGISPAITRLDGCGAVIERSAYGKTSENGTGWEVDHIKPVSKGGTDDLSNLQPLQWQNNRAKGDDYPASNYCVVRRR